MGEELDTNIPVTLGELLKDGEPDRLHLEKELSQLFQVFFGQVLGYLEVSVPGENGTKAKNFALLRSKILGSGNDKLRQMQDLLKDYFVKKVYERKRTVIDFRKKEKV